ncbi:F-box/LRR-repeat protein 13 [Carex littledalei]|uniref:F-box/LRR-repeat protein 13 n=1 Tax=Carex littledalei TaxID=544730 RepID=A0A833RUR8_9POAL|nr:F-box/LRR-repeat protein 13 [Carex littledalei]
MTSVDWISRLPDDVLNCILSRLTAKEVVQTCILSKRWRNTWASVRVLNFQLDDFDNDSDRFGRFVDSVFENRGQSCLGKVIYEGEFEDTSHGPSMQWLDRATLLMPRAIIVCINTSVDGQLIFPDSVFSCKSLEFLVLSVCMHGLSIIRPKSIALPSLQTLVLQNLCLDDDFAQKLFLGCPSLESLKLEYCDLFISDISSNVLKKLFLTGCHHYQHMRICCPSLISLSMYYFFDSTGIISLEKMTSLVNAEISLDGNDEEEDVNDLPDAQLISGLSNATSLKFYLRDPNSKEHWKKDISKCRTFRNLKSLEIKSRYMISNFDWIAYFLEHSPLLQKLTLKCLSTEENMIDAKQDVSFLVEHLETVDIHYPKDGKLPIKLMSMLDRRVKTFGNINISSVV